MTPDPSRHRSSRAWLRASASPLIGILLAVTAGCGSDEGSTAGSEPTAPTPPLVVATTGIWADVVANVACGDLAEVRPLIPDGSDPHGFEPSLGDRAELDRAALIVGNGLGLEENLADPIAAAESAGTPVVWMAPLVAGEQADPSNDVDPHVWFDPVLVGAALPALADRLVSDVGLDPATVSSCLEAYQHELEAVDAEIAQLAAGLDADSRRLVTNHDSLGYFAERYGFEVVGTVIPATSTLAESNPADLDDLAERITAEEVSAIFVETQRSADVASALGARLGVAVVELPTGTLGPSGSDSDTYVGFLRTTAETITGALG